MTEPTEPIFFIGYFDLEEWAARTIGDRVFASLHRDPGHPGEHGIRYDKLVIECAQVQEHETHYCRIPVGGFQCLNGTPFDTDTQQRFQRAEQAWGIVEQWLTNDQEFDLRNALVSIPRDLKLVEGQAKFLGYDKDNGYYRK